MLDIFDTSQSGLDPVTDQLNGVDAIIVRAVSAGDPLIATQYGNALQQSVAIKGLAMAKLLYNLQLNWDMFVAAGIQEDFEVFVEVHMNVVPQTIRKYINMWKNVFASDFIPPEIKSQLHSKPIKELLLITSAVEEGSITDEELQQVLVSDEQGIRDIVRKARGVQTSSRTAVIISVVMTDGRYPKGTILATQDGQTKVAGSLRLDSDFDFVQTAVRRIRNNSNMLERNYG